MRERVGAQQLRPWVGARRAGTPGDLDAEERLIEPDIVEVYPIRARDALAIRFPTDYVPLSSPPFFLESRALTGRLRVVRGEGSAASQGAYRSGEVLQFGGDDEEF